MTFMPQSLLAAARPARWTTFARQTVSVISVLADTIVIVIVSVLMGMGYHLMVYGGTGPLQRMILFVMVGWTRIRFPVRDERAALGEIVGEEGSDVAACGLLWCSKRMGRSLSVRSRRIKAWCKRFLQNGTCCTEPIIRGMLSHFSLFSICQRSSPAW